MKSNVNLGIEPVEKSDHAHLFGVVVHGVVTVFGHDHVDAKEAVVGGNGFEAED